MKTKTLYVCQQCGYSQPRWAGKCPSCGEWNTLVEEQQKKITAVEERRFTGLHGAAAPTPSHPILLAQIQREPEERLVTGIGELDRVLGGGIMRGSLILVGGDPGIG
ncbi:MAG: DNA repair protein RadA, partial [Bdellovibrio sp.]|nr:DNA repair protein RadA [Bdellovibrio sp.]